MVMLPIIYLGCGASVSAKNAFFETGGEISEDLPDTKLAIINADKYRDIANEFNITV